MDAVDDGEAIEAGVFSWFLANDTLYGDSLVADVFGFTPEDTAKGMPLDRYVARLHPDDRERAKRLIARAVADGQPYHAEYRTVCTEGRTRRVIALGRCFRDHNDMLFIYSGIVYPIDQL